MNGFDKAKFSLRDVYVGKRGQIVIPKDVREQIGMEPGDHLILVVDKERGIGIMKPEQLKEIAGLFEGGIEAPKGGKKRKK